MYAVKSSWVGQTFALATANDSTGRKSRVRRSKEERKSMVETFIKRYQTSNNGSFPSLNLTHKEVGGSFYTVREIVREIIQENRVLGPVRFSSELQHVDNVAGQYPLGSIATEHQVPFFNSENEQNNVSNCQVNKTTELSLDTKEYYINHQNMESFQGTREHKTNKIREDLDDQACSNIESKHVPLSKHEDCGSSEVLLNTNEQCLDENKKIIDSFMDGNQINGRFHEKDNLQVGGPLVSGNLEIDEEFVLNGGGKGQVNLPTEEVVVETFPLRPRNNEIDGVRRLTGNGDLNGTSNDQKVIPVDLTNVRPYMDKISSSVNSLDHSTTKASTGSQWSAPGRSPNIESNHKHVNGEVVQQSEGNLVNKSSDPTKSPDINEDTFVPRDCMDQISSPSAVASKTSEQYDHQSKNAPKGTLCSDDKCSKGNDKEPSYFAASANNNRRDDKAVATSSPPVDRINLQSWEKTGLKQQPNPLLAILKAFTDALIKFWS